MLLIAEFYFLVWLYRDVFTHSQVNRQAFPDLAIFSTGSNIWFVFQHWTDMGIFLTKYLGEGGVLRDADFWVMQSELVNGSPKWLCNFAICGCWECFKLAPTLSISLLWISVHQVANDCSFDLHFLDTYVWWRSLIFRDIYLGGRAINRLLKLQY